VRSERSSSARVRSPESTEGGRRKAEESEYSTVPGKQGKSLQATLWREGSTNNTDLVEGQMAGTLSPTTVSTKLHRIATVAKEAAGCVLTTLAHHIDVPFLHEA
jgi:hypothetical protein